MSEIEAEVRKRLRIVWSFQTTIKQIFKRGTNEVPEFWVHLEGSRESMFFGTDPGWKVGDKIKVTMENMDA